MPHGDFGEIHGLNLMDSLSQLALGAAVGEAVLGRRFGRRAALWGGICGTIPDLDVFIPMGDAIRDFTYHRSFSHSLFVLALLTPLIAWLAERLHPDLRPHRWRFVALVYLCFVTHVLLDCFTVYGTQIFWPIDNTPVAWGTVFIIDPLYTVPLLVGVIAALLRRTSTGLRLNTIGLVLSTLYLSWSVGAKYHATTQIEAALAGQQIGYERLLVVAAPFNTLLWRFVARSGQGYHEGFYSFLDPARELPARYFASEEQLLDGLEDDWSVQRLKWFSRGFYTVNREGDDITIADLRMGLEPNYVFRFRIGTVSGGSGVPAPVEQRRNQWQPGQVGWALRRIVEPHPPFFQPILPVAR